MPVLDPPEDWISGAITAEMLNTRVRDKIRQLQTGLPRGILSTYTTTANVTATQPSPARVAIDQWQGAFTVDSPRYLQAIVQAGVQVSGTAPHLLVIQVSFNGQKSIDWQDRLEAVGGPGTVIPNLMGVAVPVPAGTVTIVAEIVRPSAAGAGSSIINAGARMQVLDVGGS